ncbi:MAG: hypothetical protein AAF528_04130 [Cyanobacteria bacterium P01_C01_bin.121]
MRQFQIITRVIVPLVLACLGQAVSQRDLGLSTEQIQVGWRGICVLGAAGIFAGHALESSVKQWAIAQVKTEQQSQRQKLSDALSLLLAQCDELSDEARGALEVERERLKL